MHRKDELALNSWGFSLFTHKTSSPASCFLRFPFTSLRAPPTHWRSICLADRNPYFSHRRYRFFPTPPHPLLLQLSVHTAAESAEHLQEYFFSHICKHKHTTVTRCWVAGLGYPKVFLRSAAKPGGEMNALKYGQKKKEKSSSFVSTGERMREGGILQHVFLSPLSTLVWGNTGGLPRGRRCDQYYTRVELDLKWSTHLP